MAVVSKCFKKFKANCSQFKVVGERLDESSPLLQKAKQTHDHLQGTYEKLVALSVLGDGEKAIHRHTKLNRKVLPHDRVKQVLDNPVEALYLSTIAGWAMEYGNIASAGVVSVIGKVSGHDCIVVANDATVKGGTIYPITLRKQLRAQEIAFHTGLPCIYLVDSGGGFLPLQSEFFADRDHGGRIFRNQAVLTSLGVPQISLVCGNCTAGGAYVPAMSEEGIIVDRIGTIFLGGPPLVKAATGEEITSEDLGGATLHCNVSGVTDHFAPTEQKAFRICRDIVASLNLESVPNSRPSVDPLYPTDDLKFLSGLETTDRQTVYQILARIIDGSRFQEFKENFGTNLVTGFAFLAGRLVGVLANCGTLSSADSLKGAHFIQLCDKRGISIIFLQNSHAKDHQPHLTDGITLKDRGKMMSCYSTATVPKISLNIGGCFGDDNYLMGGFSMDPTFLFAWPGAHSALSLNPDLKSVESSDSDDETSKSKKKPSLPFLPSSAFYCSSRLWNDGIVPPEDTRKVLSYCVHIVMQGYRRSQLLSQAVRRM